MPRKKTIKKAKKVEVVKETPTPISSPSKRPYLVPILIGVLAIGLLAFLVRNYVLVATVNGKPITRFEIIKELEAQGGQQVLSSIVRDTLINQEAEKKGITVSEDDMNNELKKIEDSLKKQGQSLDQVLQLQGMSKDDLLKQLRVQIMIEKMLGKDIKVTDEEVNKFMDENQSFMTEGTDIEAAKQEVIQQLKSEKLNAKYQALLQELQKNAKINYFKSY